MPYVQLGDTALPFDGEMPVPFDGEMPVEFGDPALIYAPAPASPAGTAKVASGPAVNPVWWAVVALVLWMLWRPRA